MFAVPTHQGVRNSGIEPSAQSSNGTEGEEAETHAAVSTQSQQDRDPADFNM
jgi:hypothetical protein